MTKYFCDRCEREVKNFETLASISVRGTLEYFVCDDCIDNLKRYWLRPVKDASSPPKTGEPR